MSTLYNKIRARHSTSLTTLKKAHLPIIGNEMPNKLFTNFSVEDAALLVCSGTGAFDYIKAFKAKACYKMTATSSGVSLTYTPTTAIDFTSLGSEKNNYANINKYGIGGNAQDNLYFTLMWNASGSGSTVVVVKNGTKTATLTQALVHTTAGWQNVWYKSNLALNNTIWTYSAGFTDADWANVTSVIITTTASSANISMYFHGLWAALPQYQLADQATMTLTAAYYPNVAASVIYVSHLFGDDANAGTAYNAPKKTIEAGITAALSGNKDYVCIIDSATYKPIDEANYTAGINATLTRNITIIAEYLETPTISAKAGLFDATRTGVRDYYRTAFYENIGGAGTKRTVGTGGTYATIALAYAAASAGDCIEILDSAVYDETLTIAKDITIQAAPLQKPTWKYSAGNTTITSTGDYAINLFGIIFQGNDNVADTRITITNTTPTKRTRIIDCTIKNIGNPTTSSTRYGAYIKGIVTIENCIITSCGDTSTSAKYGIRVDSYSTASSYILNCTEQNRTPMGFLAVTASASKVYIIGNESLLVERGNQFAMVAQANFAASYAFLALNNCNGISSADATNATSTAGMFSNNIINGLVGLGNNRGTTYIYGNKVYSLTTPIEPYFYMGANSTGSIYVRYNTIIGAYRGFSFTDDYTWNVLTIEYNLFYNCEAALFFENTGSNMTGCSLNIFDSCTYGVRGDEASTAKSWAGSNNLYWNTSDLATNNYIITHTNKVTSDPKFLYPESDNFAWEITSAIESKTYAWRNFIQQFFNISGVGYKLYTMFCNVIGQSNVAIGNKETATSIIGVKYSTVSYFGQGIKNTKARLEVYNCVVDSINGYSIFNNNKNTEQISLIKNNIITNSYMAIRLTAAADIQYNTIVDNDYGVYGVFEGFYALEQYIKDYMTIKNNILFGNAIYDFAYDKLTDYNIIGSRLYPLTAGENDSNENPQLDADYYPATVYTGFKKNSPAYLTASDAGKHKGARNEQHLKATFAYTAYTFTDNPIGFTQELEPVNVQSTMSVAGVYEGIVDAFVAAFYMEWTEDTISDATQKAAIEAIKKTTWIVGLSFDAGSTWNYYKVELDGVLSTKQPVYILQEVPYGSYNLRVREIPNFVITDYEINSL